MRRNPSPSSQQPQTQPQQQASLTNSGESSPLKRKPTPLIRPQSAYILSPPPLANPPHQQLQQSAFSANQRKSLIIDNRRRSDFVSRYESLLNRAQSATKAVDELDLLRLQRAKTDPSSVTSGPPSTSVSAGPPTPTSGHVPEDDLDEDEVSVDFNAEEVLQRCHDFQKDYEERKNLISQSSSPPVPKPRNLIQGRPLTASAASETGIEMPKPSLRTRSSSLTLHDKNEDDKTPASSVSGAKSLKSQEAQIFPKPILKKSSDDLSTATRPILKRKDSESILVASSNAASGGASAIDNAQHTFKGNVSIRVSGQSRIFRMSEDSLLYTRIEI